MTSKHSVLRLSAAGSLEKASRVLNLDARRLERSDTVLWSLSPKGIVLHNFVRREYIELDQTGYLLWSLLDGSRSIDQVIVMCREHQGAKLNRIPSPIKMQEIISLLFMHEFIVERSHDQQ